MSTFQTSVHCSVMLFVFPSFANSFFSYLTHSFICDSCNHLIFFVSPRLFCAFEILHEVSHHRLLSLFIFVQDGCSFFRHCLVGTLIVIHASSPAFRSCSDQTYTSTAYHIRSPCFASSKVQESCLLQPSWHRALSLTGIAFAYPSRILCVFCKINSIAFCLCLQLPGVASHGLAAFLVAVFGHTFPRSSFVFVPPPYSSPSWNSSSHTRSNVLFTLGSSSSQACSSALLSNRLVRRP